MNDLYLIPEGTSGGCSRRHVLKTFAAAAGGTLLAGPLQRCLAGLPWAESPEALQLTSKTHPLNLGGTTAYEKSIHQRHPTLALEPGGGRLWTSWTRTQEGKTGIWLRAFSTDALEWGEIQQIGDAQSASSNVAHESEIAFIDGRVLVVWSELTPAGWQINARAYDVATERFGPIQSLAGGGEGAPLHAKPSMASNGKRLLVAWQTKPRGANAWGIRACALGSDGSLVGEAVDITDDSRDCCRPAVAAAPDGSGFAVAYDRQDQPGTQNVYVALMDEAGRRVGQPLQASRHPATDLAPAVAFSPDGELLWVAWHSNRSGSNGWDIPRWYELRALRLGDRTWHRPVGLSKPSPADKRYTDQGFELVRLAVTASGAVCVLGRPSHNFCLQYHASDGTSPIYRLPRDGWGGRGRWMRGAFDAHGSLWVTRRDLNGNVLHRIAGFEDVAGPPSLEPDGEAQRAPLESLGGIHLRYAWPEKSAAAYPDKLDLYFGDIHGHSWQSDGMGEPEEAYLRARDVLQDDFHVLTDHDRFVGKCIMDGQWQEQKDIAEHYHAPGKFVTLFGQEWTSPRASSRHGWGHFNIYTSDPRVPRFDHGHPRYRDLPDLFEYLRTYEAFAIPHHIGWTGVRWDVWDPELIPAVEICSVHGAFEYEGNEPISHRGGTTGSFVRDGLANGLRFGIVGGSDQHGLIWHHGVCWKRNAYRAGLTGVWAPALTRQAISDAFRARRTFATTGVKLSLRFTVNNRPMGEAITTDAPPSLRIDVAVPPEEGKLRWIEIVRNGSVVNTYGGEGQRSRYTFTDPNCPVGATSYYYLRVTLADRNMAWSSPVWVTRT
ncbi:MAG: CehA/McbA family metallohydrolase [bacterium]|nr:CehA/McbA family metallohydrolase [bacterium]